VAINSECHAIWGGWEWPFFGVDSKRGRRES